MVRPNCTLTASTLAAHSLIVFTSVAPPWLCPFQLFTPRLRPLQLLLPNCILFSCCCLSVLSHTCSTKYSKPTTDFIIMHAAKYYFCSLGGVYFQVIKGPFAIICSENKGWVYFRGWTHFRKATVHIFYNVYACMSNRNENLNLIHWDSTQKWLWFWLWIHEATLLEVTSHTCYSI